MKYVIGSLVGAVIGYITNWLAIKMLFRPHREIRMGKFRMPFTPGLIPKEKSRIARSIGQAIGQHLLTKETIIESLCSDNMNEQLEFWVQCKLNAIENDDATVESKMKSLLGEGYSNFIEGTNARISELIIGYINEESVKQAVYRFAEEQIIHQLSVSPQMISQSSLYNSIKDKVLRMVMEYSGSEKFYFEIQRFLEGKVYGLRNLDKSFDEIIPEAITNSLKEYVYSRKADIASSIKGFMRQEKVRQKLRQVVGEAVGTLNPMIAMFINADRIYEKALIGIHEFLDREENHDDMALAINSIIDGLLKSPVSNIASRLPEEGINNIIKSLVDLLKEKAADEKFIKDTYARIEARFNDYTSIGEMLKEAGIDYKAAMGEFVKPRIEAMVGSHTLRIKLTEAVSMVINRLLALEMKSIFREAERKISPSVSKMIRDLYNRFIENNAAGVIEVLNVAQIVEDKISDFDVDYTEELILEVANKELRAITWLGALLGAIMGILSPVISSFY